MRNFSSIGMMLALFCTISTPAVALGATQIQPNDGFIDQEKPDWMKASPIPAKLNPSLTEAINAANLIKHETSTLQINSPTYEQAHRLLLQHLHAMQRQLHFNEEDLLRFQSRPHRARSTVDPRIYEPNPLGIALLPPRVVKTGGTYIDREYVKPSRRSIIRASERRNALRVSNW